MAIQGTRVQRPWVGVAASILLIGSGAFLLKTCVFDVLAAAARHEPSVSLSVKGVLIAPTALILGVVALGASIKRGGTGGAGVLINQSTRKLTPIGWAVVAGLLAVGGGLYFWLRSQLVAYGYDV
jgi:hypothetical protein